MYFIKNFLKNHYLIIILGIFLTFLIEIPVIGFPFIAGDKYQGINIVPFGTDSYFYLSRAKDAMEGNNLGNPVLREEKNQQDVYFTYNERLLIAPIRLLGLQDKVNVVTLFNIYNFIGIFILILLIYFFILQLSGNKLLSAAAALFAVGGYHIIYNKSLFYNDFNIYGRPNYPYLGSLAFFIYLNFLFKSINVKKLIYKISAILSFGLLFYVYFYAWTFALALNAALILVYLFKKDFENLKYVLIISIGGFILGFYNILKLFLFVQSDIGKQSSYFMWTSSNHVPIFSKIGFISLVLLAIYFYKKRKDVNLIFITALILAGWAALNQQVITGTVIQYAHYYWFFIVPISIIVGLYMIWLMINKQIIQKVLFIFVMIIVFLSTGIGQYQSILRTMPTRLYEQSYQPLIDVLKSDNKSGVILTAPDAYAYLFTIYTPHDLFWRATTHYAPIQRMKDALFVYFYINKYSRNDFVNYLNGLINSGKQSVYLDLYKDLEGYWSGFNFYDYEGHFSKNNPLLLQKRKETIDSLYKEYSEIIKKENNIKDILDKYEVNYIVWDKNKYPEWDLSVLGDLDNIASYNNIYLYKLN